LKRFFFKNQLFIPDVVVFVTVSNADRQSPLADPMLTITSATVQSVTASFTGFTTPAQNAAFNGALRMGLRQLIAANPNVVTEKVRLFIQNMP
jgi:hypothetical protein